MKTMMVTTGLFGAGHGFYRSGQDPEGSEANREAREQAEERVLKILGTL